MTDFLVVYGPEPTIEHPACGKRERMFGRQNGEPTVDDVRRYRRIHVCGPADEGWDVDRSGGR